jgi:prepilin-type N-terminal cleavage/methylation domain-containing protein
MRPFRGFTLIEVLVVVAVIAILASLLFPIMGYAQRRSAETRARTFLAGVAGAIDMYAQDRGRFPACPGGWASGSTTWADACGSMLYVELVSVQKDRGRSGAERLPRPGYLRDTILPGNLAAPLGTDAQLADAAYANRLIDQWGNSLLYYAAPYPAGGPAPFAGSATQYELWSMGPDGAFADLRANAADPLDPDNDNIPAKNYAGGPIR